MGKKIDRTGRKYERLTVLYKAGQDKWGNTQWYCRCFCGNELIVRGGSLHSGNTKSCGCLQREKVSRLNVSHKLRKHPLYSVWCGIKKRCYNKNSKDYENYGGRRISVWPKWKMDFMAFYKWAKNSGWKKELTIDRIDNDGDYEPKNCQFIPMGKNTLKKQPLQKNNTSGYRGVTYHKQTQKYEAGIGISGSYKYLGCFDDPIKAALAYDQEARNAGGERPTNFSWR